MRTLMQRSGTLIQRTVADNLTASVSLQQLPITSSTSFYLFSSNNKPKILTFIMVSQQQQQQLHHVQWRRRQHISWVALVMLFMSSVDQTHGFVSLFSEYRQSAVVPTTRVTTTVTRSLALCARPGSISSLNMKQKRLNDDKLHEQQKELYSSEARQLLGLKKGTSSSSSSLSSSSATAAPPAKWKIRLQLTKPVTWVPLSMIVMCGAAASGNYHWIWNPLDPNDRNVALGLRDAVLGLATVILAGPFSEGFAQTINDWYDKDIDAINEPYRPIPSGAIAKNEVFEQLWFLFLGGLSLSLGLDYATGHLDTTNTNNNSFPMVTAIALFGYFVSYIYSAPPLKLKQNGWAGDIAIGTCYISLPWWCGQSVFGHLDRPESWIIPLVYSMVGLGAGIINDFKSMEGDKAFGLKSIPILLGVDKAKWLAALLPDIVQVSMATYLYSIGEITTAACLLALIVPQIYFQQTLLLSAKDPSHNDVKYMTMTQPLVMLGVIATALCLGQHQWPI